MKNNFVLCDLFLFLVIEFTKITDMKNKFNILSQKIFLTIINNESVLKIGNI